MLYILAFIVLWVPIYLLLVQIHFTIELAFSPDLKQLFLIICMAVLCLVQFEAIIGIGESFHWNFAGKPFIVLCVLAANVLFFILLSWIAEGQVLSRIEQIDDGEMGC